MFVMHKNHPNLTSNGLAVVVGFVLGALVLLDVVVLAVVVVAAVLVDRVVLVTVVVDAVVDASVLVDGVVLAAVVVVAIVDGSVVVERVLSTGTMNFLHYIHFKSQLHFFPTYSDMTLTQVCNYKTYNV